MMKKIIITGGNGLIGSQVVKKLGKDYQLIFMSHDKCDLTDNNAVEIFLEQYQFDFLLHLAAYTDVDGAEKEKDKAYLVNVEGTKNLFDIVLRKKKKMIFLSTDFVFSGNDGPYFEDSQPSPIGMYGQTKYDAEQVVKDKAMIVRISYPYGHSTDKKKEFC